MRERERVKEDKEKKRDFERGGRREEKGGREREIVREEKGGR